MGDSSFDRANLPSGGGTAQDGASLFAQRCTTCHMEGRGLGDIRTDWPYARSLFEYIRRAMPPDRPRTLSAEQGYALTAYVLWASGILAPHDSLDAHTISNLRMPAKDAFEDSAGKPLP